MLLNYLFISIIIQIFNKTFNLKNFQSSNLQNSIFILQQFSVKMSSNTQDAKAPVKSKSTEKAADAEAAARTSDLKKDSASKADSKRDTGTRQGSHRARRSKAKGGADAPAPVKKYMPKLMTEEDEDEKTVLIKISRATTVRQVINYSIGKIKNDWKVTFNAF